MSLGVFRSLCVGAVEGSSCPVDEVVAVVAVDAEVVVCVCASVLYFDDVVLVQFVWAGEVSDVAKADFAAVGEVVDFVAFGSPAGGACRLFGGLEPVEVVLVSF